MSVNLVIVKDDFFVYDDLPAETTLREDMYQATLGEYAIDCGWYGNAEDGSFITYLIKDCDWDTPIIKILTKKFEDAKWSVNVCKEYLTQHL
jgi:hypothetical protein